jgi:hypothetical protein
MCSISPYAVANAWLTYYQLQNIFFLKLPPYTLAGFDLTTRNNTGRDNTTRPRCQGKNIILYKSDLEVLHFFNCQAGKRAHDVLIFFFTLILWSTATPRFNEFLYNDYTISHYWYIRQKPALSGTITLTSSTKSCTCIYIHTKWPVFFHVITCLWCKKVSQKMSNYLNGALTHPVSIYFCVTRKIHSTFKIRVTRWVCEKNRAKFIPTHFCQN